MKHLKMITLLFMTVPFFCLAIYRFLPAKYDAFACGGGFNSYIYRKSISELSNIYCNNNDISSNVIFTDDYTVGYQGRNIYINATVNYMEDGNIVKEDVSFKGKRIWTEKYIWKEIKPGS